MMDKATLTKMCGAFVADVADVDAGQLHVVTLVWSYKAFLFHSVSCVCTTTERYCNICVTNDLLSNLVPNKHTSLLTS